jgi:hypothetical protein
MSALFEEILRRRHQIQQQTQVQQHSRYQKIQQREHTWLIRVNARKSLDQDTLRVLEDFKQCAYPSMQVRTYAQGWSLGRWVSAPDKSQAWEAIIEITLRYDSKDKPVSYECRGHNRRLVASLTTEALRQTLLRLYRPKPLSAAGQASKTRR